MVNPGRRFRRMREAKTPAETRTLVTELERCVRVAEEVVGDNHVKNRLARRVKPDRISFQLFPAVPYGWETGFSQARVARNAAGNIIITTVTKLGCFGAS